MPNTANPKAPTSSKTPATPLPRPWLILSIGAVLGAVLATTVTDTYFPSISTTLVTLLSFIGPAAPFIPLAMVAIIGALFGAELAALILVLKIASGNLLFLWNTILSLSAVAGAGLGLFLALTVPAVFAFAREATHNAFPAIMPWIFIAGFGFVANTFLAYLGYRGALTIRERRAA